jgi:hypothetical protein
MAPDLRKQVILISLRIKEADLPRPLIGREPTVPVSFRIEPSIWKELAQKAKQDDKGVAELARIAIYQYLDRNPVTLAIDANITEQDWWDHRVAVHDGNVALDDTCSVCNAGFALMRKMY